MKKHSTLLKVLFLFLSLTLSFQGFSQGIKISGKVTDANDGKTMPGVTIAVKNTTTGTISDIDGNFSITVNRGATLVFSFIGYNSQEVVVGDQSTLKVVMVPSVTTLEEAVVIGYGTVKKSDLTGSVSTVSSKDFNKGAITSAQDLLVGKSAGVIVTNSGGAPTSGSTIRVRGGSSLNASNDPLIIIDGMPIDNSNISGSSNFLSFVNPNDIETFTVLKDASATAIYGSRASNGVIIITTKKGVIGTPLKLTYDGSVSFSAPAKYVDVFSGDEMRQIAYEHPDLYDADAYRNLGNENTVWQKEIFRTAVSHDHNLGLTGAYKNLPYRVSLGYTDQQGILKNTGVQRFTGSVGLNPTFLKDNLKVSINAKGMSSKNNFGDSGAVGSAVNMDPTQVVKNGDPNYGGYFQWQAQGADLGTPNPVEQLMEVDNKADVNRFIGNIQLDYTMPFLPGLRANLNLATDYAKSEGHNNRPTTSPFNISSNLWGKLTDFNGKNTNDLLDFYLNYTKDLTQIRSKIDLTGGYSWQHFQLENFNYERGTVDAEHLYERNDSTTKFNELQLVSFFGRLNYTLMDNYLFTFTIRDDGSSRFSEENRWGIFPAVAFAWKLKDEAFLKDVSVLSDLKLRLGWGVTGQQDITDQFYPYLARYNESTQGNYYLIDGEYIPTLRPQPYDKDIKWEETTTQNIGIDFGFVNDRITGSFDLYKRETTDLINLVTIPAGSNFSNTLYTNVGSLENRGVEFTLNLIPILKKEMSLNLGFNLTYNKNEVTKLLASDDPNYLGVLYGDGMTGTKQVTRVGYSDHSFYVNEQVYDANGNPIEGLYTDLSGEGGTVNGDNLDKYIYHSPKPDYLLGFSFRYNYKKFDFAGSSRASIGNYVYNQVAAGASYDQMQQIGYWKNQTTLLNDTKFIKRQFTSDYFVENASFFKLDYLSAGYAFNNISGKLNLRLSFTVQNVFTITKYSGLDPEIADGIDNNFYPRPRTFLVGLSLGY